MQTQSEGRVASDYRPSRGHLARFTPETVKEALAAGGEVEYERRLKSIESARIEQARSDFLAFCEYVMVDERTGEPLRVQWYQEDWYEALKEYARLLIIAPRGHGKTATAIMYVLWCIGRDPNMRVKK